MAKLPTDYKYCGGYFLIDAYEFPYNKDEWLPCSRCKLVPKVWCFNNGCTTGCGCYNSMYDHFSIRAESIMSVHIRTGKIAEPCGESELKRNWNHFVTTGEILFDNDYKLTGRW